MAQVRIEHIFKRFGGVTAVNDFDLVVEDGEFVSILGPSGCGKTTTLRMVAGFERATEGEIYIGEQCVSSSLKNKFVPPEKRCFTMVRLLGAFPTTVSVCMIVQRFFAAQITHRAM